VKKKKKKIGRVFVAWEFPMPYALLGMGHGKNIDRVFVSWGFPMPHAFLRHRAWDGAWGVKYYFLFQQVINC
jgi:hypothetical protein